MSKEMNLVLQLQDPVNLNNKAKRPEFIAQTDIMSGALTLLPLSRKGTRLLSVYSALYHSFSSLSYDRSKASSKASSPHSAIQSFLFQMRVSSPFLKVIQLLPTSSSLSSCHLCPPLYLSFSNPL